MILGSILSPKTPIISFTNSSSGNFHMNIAPPIKSTACAIKRGVKTRYHE